MKFTLVFIGSYLLSSMALAQLSETAQEAEKAADKVIETLNQSQHKRSISKTFILGSYSSMDLIIPGKYGLSIGRIKSVERTWEFEYLNGSLSVPSVIADLGKMEDKRFSWIQRNYFKNNSFNFSYGLTYFAFDINLGDKYMSAVSGNYPSAKVLEVNALGFNLAVGNRWSLNNNFTIGFDWFSWAQPVFITEKHNSYSANTNNQEYRKDVDRAVKVLGYFPRLAVVKFQLGATF